MTYAPTVDEWAWIDGSVEPRQARMCTLFAAAVNLLEIKHVRPAFADECTYESQSVTDRLEGVDAVVSYLRGKFDAVRKAGDAARISAELSTAPGDGRPCVLAHQRSTTVGQPGLGQPVGFWIVEVTPGEQISSLLMVTAVPAPASCAGSSLFPGLSAEDLSAGGERLPASTNLRIVLYSFGPLKFMSDQVKPEIESVLREFPSVEFVTVEDDQDVFSQKGVTAFPTIDIMHGDELLRRIEGLASAASIRRCLIDMREDGARGR